MHTYKEPKIVLKLKNCSKDHNENCIFDILKPRIIELATPSVLGTVLASV